MKSFLFAIMLFSFLGVKAQKNESSNTEVDSVFTGQIIKDKTQNSRIYLTNFKQTLDSTGIFTTTYIFGVKRSSPTFDINVTMKFDSPAFPYGGLGFEYGPYGVGRFSGSGGLRNNNMFLVLQEQVTSSTHHFFIKIKSKQKPHPIINGIEGQSNF